MTAPLVEAAPLASPHPSGPIGRRTLLGLGLAAVAGVAGPAPAARAAEVTLGRFAFDVPATIRAQAQPRAGWQWEGQQLESGAPSIVVLARADLADADPHEVLGLLLASSAGGWLPELSVDPTRDGTTRDGSPALRQPISFQPAPKITYQGTLLITRNRDTAAVLAVIGTARLTAGRTDQILDSAGWSG
jgi:hypothetical protein